jgi:tripartite-type tricarboxylate transporter receptor subunit TctC
MKFLHRRQFLHLAAGAAALPALSRIARAEAYPSRPVRIIVGTAAGGSSDLVGRLMGQWLSERLGQQCIIENRPGAGTNIATESVVNAAPDGHTLLLASAAGAINATLYEKLRFDFVRDIMPVASVIRVANVIEVNLSVPIKTLPELIAYAKANPGKLNMASPGVGTGPYMAGELLKMMAGINIVDVPYRGTAPAHTDLLGGQVQAMFDGVPGSIEFIRAGKLRALAVTSATRSMALPDVPVVSDFIPGYEASSWWGVGAPRNTPSGIVDKLNMEINAGLTDPKMKARLTELGGTALSGSPADFGTFITDETEKWGKVVKFAGMKAE